VDTFNASPGGAGDRRALDCGEDVLERGGTAQPRLQLKASAAQIRVIARARLSETPPTRVPSPEENTRRNMCHRRRTAKSCRWIRPMTIRCCHVAAPPRFGSRSPLPAPGGGRDEHLEWCKERARDYLDAGELSNAVASMGSEPRQASGVEAEPAPVPAWEDARP
jgi:hypothetical protein